MAFPTGAYPTHDREMRESVSGALRKPCLGTLILPQQAGRAKDPTSLYCQKCKRLLAADDATVDKACAAAGVPPPQRGYPPHDHLMRHALTGKEMPACAGPLLLPEQAGIKAELGVLYCPGCNSLLVGDGLLVDKAAKAAERDGFVSGRASVTAPSPPTPAKRAKPDATKVTLNLFQSHPQYHAKVGRDGRAR